MRTIASRRSWIPATIACVVSLLFALALLAAPIQAAFPGENGKIAFSSWRANPCGIPNVRCDSDIYSINPDGTGLLRLTNDEGVEAHDLSPTWSPDGTKIAFSSYRDADACCEIYTMNADGTGLTKVTNSVGCTGSNACVVNGTPAWSPDGSQIAFGRLTLPDGCSNVDIYTINADGTGLRQVTATGGLDDFPSWSPDGSQIAYSGAPNPCTGRQAIYTVKPDGTGKTPIVDFIQLGGEPVAPDWSPDGENLLLTVGTDIYTVRRDGSQPTNITQALPPGGGGSWSPDGQKIATTFGSESIQGGGVWTMDADGSNARFVTEGGGPDWQPTTASLDTDGDGVPDESDNCAAVANPAQVDRDHDGIGDTCDSDNDNDGIDDSVDNCPSTANDDQADSDHDGLGDACDSTPLPDGDGDGVADSADNCPGVSNTSQTDSDHDGIGDACEPTPIPGPKRSDYKNSSHFCKADRDFLGEAAFRQKYGGGANAHGKCVSEK